MKVHDCPRCGGSPILDKRTLITYVICHDCGYTVMDTESDEAIRKWNEDKECKDACSIS